MYYGWNNLKVIHDERVKQLTSDNKQKTSNLIKPMQAGFVRLWSGILHITRIDKPKRNQHSRVCKSYRTSKSA